MAGRLLEKTKIEDYKYQSIDNEAHKRAKTDTATIKHREYGRRRRRLRLAAREGEKELLDAQVQELMRIVL